ncbi:hypothetical protein Clacol_009439 [Clathrus columnatus]|uniref:Uncharacterized protein n=1 Tax=Clathrus columnatus TaxID=1419009 RepID=A0AAV5AKL5_9AGAM|nr:hypothetical protein Clacol_009439 [Clathrus columnatus]
MQFKFALFTVLVALVSTAVAAPTADVEARGMGPGQGHQGQDWKRGMGPGQGHQGQDWKRGTENVGVEQSRTE